MLGGGGYTMRNVSRAWAYETGLAAGVELGAGKVNTVLFIADTDPIIDIPINEYYEYFGPDYQLDVKSSNMEDMNTRGYLDRVKGIVMEHLRHVGGPPGVQMTGNILPSLQCESKFTTVLRPDIPHGPLDAQMDDPNEDEDLIPPDVRRPRRLLDSRRQADGELSDSDDEGEDDRRNHQSHREPDVTRRFGTTTGIMQTGSTHGIGPTITLPMSSSSIVASGAAGAAEGMEIDEDDAPLAQTVRGNSKRPATPSGSAMAVDPPVAPVTDSAPAPAAAPVSEPSEAPKAEAEAAPNTSS